MATIKSLVACAGYTVLAHVLGLFTLMFVPPSATKLRYLCLLVISRCGYLAVLQARPIPEVARNIACYLTGFILYAHYFLIVTRESAIQSSHRLLDAIRILFSPRKHLSPRQIPAFRKADPLYVPSRRQFLRQRTVDLMLGLAIVYLTKKYYLTTYAEDFVPPRHSITGRLFLPSSSEDSIDTREVVVRLYYTVSILLQTWNTQKLIHTAASLFGVGALGQEPSQWPPMFGDLSEAYTVRRYYAIANHTVMRKAFTGNARYVVEMASKWLPGCGHLLKGNVARWMTVALALLVTGLMHVVALTTDPDCPATEELGFSFALGATIALEGLLGKLASHVRVSWVPQRYLRWLGYVWVFLFHFWVIPDSTFPAINCRVSKLR